jgi:hypothetical protein
MASIRTLKKDINALTYDLLSKCYSIKSYEPDIRDEKFDEVISKIVYLRNDLILRANHPESDAESESLSQHYRKVKEDLYELLKVIEELKK